MPDYTNSMGLQRQLETLGSLSNDIYIRNNSYFPFYAYRVYIPGVSTTKLPFDEKQLNSFLISQKMNNYFSKSATLSVSDLTILRDYIFDPDTFASSLVLHNLGEDQRYILYAALLKDLGDPMRALSILDMFEGKRSKCAALSLRLRAMGYAIINDRISAYYCEPFMISGLLPTLGPAIVRQALNNIGVSGKVFYPALHFFIEDCKGGTSLLMRLADDIPLQITDLFFCDENAVMTFLSGLPEEYKNTADILELKHLRRKAICQVDKVIDSVKNERPDLFCISVTFGSAFAEYLIPRIRKASEKTVIFVGGSCCTPEYAEQLLEKLPEIDYILCDESTESLVQTIQSLFFGQGEIPSCVCFKGHEAETFHSLSSLDGL